MVRPSDLRINPDFFIAHKPSVADESRLVNKTPPQGKREKPGAAPAIGGDTMRADHLRLAVSTPMDYKRISGLRPGCQDLPAWDSDRIGKAMEFERSSVSRISITTDGKSRDDLGPGLGWNRFLDSHIILKTVEDDSHRTIDETMKFKITYGYLTFYRHRSSQNILILAESRSPVKAHVDH